MYTTKSMLHDAHAWVTGLLRSILFWTALRHFCSSPRRMGSCGCSDKALSDHVYCCIIAELHCLCRATVN